MDSKTLAFTEYKCDTESNVCAQILAVSRHGIHAHTRILSVKLVASHRSHHDHVLGFFTIICSKR